MYEGPERRAALTDEQIELIAERAAEKALEKVYASVGRSVVQKFLWILGASALALAAWLKGSGKI
jgi:hypothetical protein